MTERSVALVTGSARGIGRAIALRLANDGFNLALNDIASQKENLEILCGEIEGLGRKAVIYIADVSKEDEVKAMVDETVEVLGRLDVMVANAGMCLRFSGLMDNHVFAVNTRGVFLCYKYAAMQMVKQGWDGRIIGANSVAGMRAQSRVCPYSASKFAVRGLTQSAAVELGPHQITVNAYAPAPANLVLTPEFPLKVRQSENTVALKKTGQPGDLASLVSYLASPES
ncbi:NAD(P)-binding protein [Armillaria borealis]|uniref:NAD(P)-binding protein n=1 Tax=Armillaria borealis TaxID=47425 RepID=A0AA39MLJ3_9AGAR|nr:NAD(P)-binding protein [Armillaria borealis]